MVTILTLAHSTIGTVDVFANSVTVSGKKNNIVKPRVNGDDLAYVQTQSYENLKYIISGVNFTGVAGSFAYTDLLELYKVKYDGTNPIIMRVVYGNNITLPNLSEATTGIYVMLDDFSFPIDVTATKDGYIPKASLTFTETK